MSCALFETKNGRESKGGQVWPIQNEQFCKQDEKCANKQEKKAFVVKSALKLSPKDKKGALHTFCHFVAPSTFQKVLNIRANVF